jgi:large conductance mechanosensitive channel
MSIIKGFKQFIIRGNAIDLAVGVVIGAAFGQVVNSLVKDIITPFIGAIAKVPDFSGLSFTIRGSVFMYGNFLNILISFILSAAAIYFFVVLPINAIHDRRKKNEPAPAPTTKKCPECLGDIPLAATRCAHCTMKLG